MCVTDPQLTPSVLRKAPLGSSVGDVKALIQSQRWKLDFEWEGTNSPTSPRDYPYVKGSRIIGAYLGGYQGIPLACRCGFVLAIDDKGKLIDFHGRKDYDAL